MNRKNILLAGLFTSMRQWRITLIAYFIQWCLALTIGMQVFDVFKASIGNSLEINKLVASYDHTVITDFLKVHGASITPLIGQLRWLLFVWLIFSVFIDAGILASLTETKDQKSARPMAFWQGGAAYFFPFLKICLFILGFVLIWTLLILSPIALYFEPSIQYFTSEKYSVWLVLLLLALYLFGLMLFFIWSVLSRLAYIRTGASIWSSLKTGWRLFWQKKWAFMGLILGFEAFFLLILSLYWTLSSLIGMVSPLGILVVFLLQQAFVFFRIQWRQSMYAGLHQLSSGAELPTSTNR